MSRCRSCHGTGQVSCSSCGGRRHRARLTESGDMDMSACLVCGGRGHMRCNSCGGQGRASGTSSHEQSALSPEALGELQRQLAQLGTIIKPGKRAVAGLFFFGIVAALVALTLAYWTSRNRDPLAGRWNCPGGSYEIVKS